MKNTTKIVSVSMMIVAAQAMAVSAKETAEIIDVNAISVTNPAVLNTLAKRDVRLALGAAYPDVVTHFGVEGERLLDRVLVAQAGNQAAGPSRDFTENGDLTSPSPGYSNVECHSACHSNCHRDGGGYC